MSSAGGLFGFGELPPHEECAGVRSDEDHEFFWSGGPSLLTAMMCLCHPGSGLTLLLTGSDALQLICRLDPEMAYASPSAVGAVTL